MIPTESQRVGDFYKQFSVSQQGQDIGLLSGLVKEIVVDLLSDGGTELGDHLVTRIGRAIKVQEERGIL